MEEINELIREGRRAEETDIGRVGCAGCGSVREFKFNNGSVTAISIASDICSNKPVTFRNRIG